MLRLSFFNSLYQPLLQLSIALLLCFNMTSAQAANQIVTIETNYGNIVAELYPNKAPLTVANFVEYAKTGFYNNTIFHRVINNFMIQGGGMTEKLEEKITGPAIKNEATNGLKNEIGTLAMARTEDPDSATSQFFINLGKNQFLDHRSPDRYGMGYCVFGRVLIGMDVVREIGASPTGTMNGMGDVPKIPVTIMRVTVK